MTVLDYLDDFAQRYEHYKGGTWCYEDGCIYRGLLLLHRSTGETRWFDHLLRLTAPQISADGALAGYDPEDYNIDNILAGRCLFHLADETGDARYMKAAEQLIAQLKTHPRTKSGNYWHKKRYPWQIWLDGLYMGLPFQTEFGLRTGNRTLVDDAIAQVRSALPLLRGPAGLYVHAYDEAREQPWAYITTGQSAAVWARALGWLAMAMADMRDLLEAEHALSAETNALMEAIVAQQDESGLWMQVLDAPGLPGNYTESSASAMFAYALLVAARLEPHGVRFAAAGRKAHDALIMNRIIDVDGTRRMIGICHVAGLGMYEGRFRDGSPGYYLTEPLRDDDSKGVGPLMMATAEMLRRQRDHASG